MWKKIFLSAVCVLLLAGCGGGEGAVEPYLSDLERVLTLHDQLSAVYLDALEAAEVYTMSPGPENLRAAKKSCTAAMATIAALEEVDSALTDIQRADMEGLGMDQADYMTPFRMQTYEKRVRLQDLTDVLYYLNRVPEQNDILSQLVKLNISFENYDRKIQFLGLNHLLAEISDRELEHFQLEFLPALVSYEGEPLAWESDRAVLEAQSETLLIELEDLIGEASEDLGTLYAGQRDQERDIRAELEAGGLPPEEADRLCDALERLEAP